MTSGRNAMTLLTRGRANSSHGAAVVRVGEQVHTEGSRAAGDEAEAGVAAVHAGVAGAGRVASLDGRAGLGAAGRGGGNALGTVSAAGREALVATERAAAAEAERSGVRGGSGASIADEVCTRYRAQRSDPGLGVQRNNRRKLTASATNGGGGESLRRAQEGRAGSVLASVGRRSGGGDGGSGSRTLAPGGTLTLDLASGGELRALDAGGEVLAGLGTLLDGALVGEERRRTASEDLISCREAGVRRSALRPIAFSLGRVYTHP